MRIPRRNFSVPAFVCFALLCTAASAQQKPAENAPKYRDPNLAIDDRVADLLSRMTLEEKVQQITGGGRAETEVIDPTGTYTTESARAVFQKWWDPNLVFPARNAAILRNGVQRFLKEKSRLGIPALFMGEALHGYMEYGSTSFPQAIGLASTWDPELVKQLFAAAGDESGAAGAGQVFTPVLDLARDPRWGRTEETYGEDSFLLGRLGSAYVQGVQEYAPACVKHYAANNVEHKRETDIAQMDEQTLQEVYARLLTAGASDDPEVRSVRAFALTVARNVAFDWLRHRQVDSAGREQARGAVTHPRIAQAGDRSPHRHHEPRVEERISRYSRDVQRRVPERSQGEMDREQRLLPRHDGRSNRREGDRSGDAAAVDGTLDGSAPDGRPVRQRLCLRLSEQSLVVVADDAASR